MQPKFGENSETRSFEGFIRKSNSKFENSSDLKNVIAISMQTNFSHIISFKGASKSAGFLTNGDYVRYLHEKYVRWKFCESAGEEEWRNMTMKQGTCNQPEPRTIYTNICNPHNFESQHQQTDLD